MAEESLCEQCDAKCCRYFALEIDKPRSRRDFDDIRWYLCHEDTVVFVEEGKWYLEVKNRCRHLDASNRCRVYPDRPALCREHSIESCERREDCELQREHEFHNDAELAAFAKAHFEQLARRLRRNKRRKGKKR